MLLLHLFLLHRASFISKFRVENMFVVVVVRYVSYQHRLEIASCRSLFVTMSPLRKRREFLLLHIFCLHPRPSYQKNCSRDIKFNCFNFWCFLASLLEMIADGKMEGEPKRSKGTSYRWIWRSRQIYSFHLGQNRTLTIFKAQDGRWDCP